MMVRRETFSILLEAGLYYVRLQPYFITFTSDPWPEYVVEVQCPTGSPSTHPTFEPTAEPSSPTLEPTGDCFSQHIQIDREFVCVISKSKHRAFC